MQDKIKKIEQYFKSIEINEGILIVKLNLNEKWGVYPSKDEKIKVVKSKTIPNEWMYYGNYGEVSIDDMFTLINETIDMNLNVERKIKLLTEKIDELKKIFSTEPLEKLNNLVFVFNDAVEIKPKKRKYNRKKKTNTISDTINVVKNESKKESNETQEINKEKIEIVKSDKKIEI